MIGSRSYSWEVCRHESRSKRLHVLCVNEDVKQRRRTTRLKRGRKEKSVHVTLWDSVNANWENTCWQFHLVSQHIHTCLLTIISSFAHYFRHVALDNNLKWYEIIFILSPCVSITIRWIISSVKTLPWLNNINMYVYIRSLNSQWQMLFWMLNFMRSISNWQGKGFISIECFEQNVSLAKLRPRIHCRPSFVSASLC